MDLTNMPTLNIRRRAFSNVQPWTHDDGLTQMELLSDLARYIRQELVPFIRDGLDNFSAEVIAELQARLDSVVALIDEAQQIRDDVQTIADEAVAEVAGLRDQAVTEINNLTASAVAELESIRDTVRGYRDAAEGHATDAANSSDAAEGQADRAENISDAMDSVYQAVVSMADALQADIDSLASRERVAELSLGAVVPVAPYANLHARASTGTGAMRIVCLGSSTPKGTKATTSADVFSRIARRAKISDIADLGVARADAGSFRNGAIGGSRSNNFINGTVASQLNSFDPHHVFVIVGSNDANNNISVGVYENNMVDAYAQIVSAAPNAVVTFIHSQSRSSVSQSLWDSYRDALERAANATGAMFIDATKHERFNRNGSNSAGMLLNDGTHMTDSGHRYLADIISAEVGLPIPPPSYDVYIGNLEGRGPRTTDFDIYSMELPSADVPRVVIIHATPFLRYEGDGTGGHDPALTTTINGLETGVKTRVEEMPGSFPYTATRFIPAGEAIEIVVTVTTNGRFLSSSDILRFSRITTIVTSV